MQRWFFLEDPKNASIRTRTEPETDSDLTGTIEIKTKPWTFRVQVPETLPDETVCVTGNTETLGNWFPDKCVPLQREHGSDSEFWSGQIHISDNIDVLYRYCICMMIGNEMLVVRKWETNIQPRRIFMGVEQTKVERDTFGEFGNYNRIDYGWLTEECVVQLKLFNDPLTLWKPKLAKRIVYIKVTPVNLTRHSTDRPANLAEALEESLSTDTQDVLEHPKYARTLVASLNSENSSFEEQGQFGMQYNPGDLLMYETSVLELKNIAFLIDLYIYSSRASNDDPPHHVGFSYLLPSALRTSEGHVVLPVTSVKHRPLGQIEFNYLVIKSMAATFKCDMSVSYARHWKHSRIGLDVGHRGFGASFKIDKKHCAEVRENTIASLKTAASHGADFVEFDVQLSKDLVPVIYHDFHVCIAMKRKRELVETEMLELAVKELTLEQLHLLKIYHLSEGKSRYPKFFDEDLDEHQPFPTLQQVLEVIDPHIGFNVEIKWSNQRNDGSNELDHSMDINLYIDKILEVVLRYGAERRIIFSCFNPDMCRIMRLKQNKYPVMFLTQGQTERYPHYRDPRCQTIQAAVQFAVSAGLLGINVHTEDLLRDGTQVRLATEAGLVMFCWGDDNNDAATIKHLKELGLHAVIYDKIDQYTDKTVKESIFLIEARESQRQQLRLLAAATAENTAPVPPPVSELSLDVEQARQGLNEISTATSLESLESLPQ